MNSRLDAYLQTIGTLLDTARQIFNNHLVDTRDLLRQLKREDRQR